MFQQKEMESERRPLIESFPINQRKRNLCRRIPFEITATGIIVGSFLLVITLLIILENLKSSSDQQLTLTKELLDSSKPISSPLNSEKNLRNDKVNLLKKSKYTEDDSTETNDDSKQSSSSSKTKDWSKKYSTKKPTEKQMHWESKYIEDYSTERNDDSKQSSSSSKPKDWSKKHTTKIPRDHSTSPEDSLKFNPLNIKETVEYIKNYIRDKIFKRKSSEDDLNSEEEFVSDNALGESSEEIFDSNEKYISDKTLGNPQNLDRDKNLIWPLRSPFKYNKKILDETWQDKKQWTKENFPVPQSDYNQYKWKNNYLGKSQDMSTKLLASQADALGPLFQYHQKNFSYVSRDKIKKTIMPNKYINEYKWDNVDKGWKKLQKTDISAPTRCPFKKFKSSTVDSLLMQSYVDCAHILEEIRKEYGNCIDLSFLPKECKPSWRTKCFSSYKYRKIDGSCNNRIHPTWGRSGTPFVRMIAPDYRDGSSSFRTSKDGSPLPNARLLSQQLYSKHMKNDIDVSLLFVYFGLLVDHDMIETAVNTGNIPCCDEFFQSNPKIRPKECLQIDILPDDAFYGPKNVSCLNLMRSIPVQGECIGRREQLNKATSYLDGSAIYGSSMDRAKAIRAFSKGQLKTQRINNNPFMSSASETGYTCGTNSEPLKCFAAGDSRVNMLVDLAAMHTLWYREHNRIAEKLHELNPQLIDETLYQEARRIVIAELQHITYKEFLPILMGSDAMDFFNLKIDENNVYDKYDETIDSSVFNVFGAAAFRFGHTLVQDMLNLIGSDNATKGSVPLHETYFNLKLLYDNKLDSLLRGAAKQKIHSVEPFMSEEIRNHLFQPPHLDYGFDLGAIGIMRGRDHGLPSYTKWRSVCGLPEINAWDDLNQFMDSEIVTKLKAVYKYVEDIDLIPGALAEYHVEGSLLGPTHLCIIGRQFSKTRKGDRFWYESQNTLGSFTTDQLKEIYHSSLSRIICDNSDDVEKLQKFSLKTPSTENPIVNCDVLPSVDLSLWKMSY